MRHKKYILWTNKSGELPSNVNHLSTRNCESLAYFSFYLYICLCHSLLDFKLIFLSSISNCNFNFNPLDYLRSRKFFFLCKNLNCHEQNPKGNFKQAYIYLIQRKIERKLTTISFSHGFKNKREKERTQGEFCIKFILQIEIVK